jgi:hypothetical protein
MFKGGIKEVYWGKCQEKIRERIESGIGKGKRVQAAEREE